MCRCVSIAVVPQHIVLPRLLPSAMHVTPGLLPLRRCWWDGSLAGPAAAPDMLLIYNAQLWQRNQRCLYAKLAGAKSWWEMSRSSHWHTVCSDCILMIRIAVLPIRCCVMAATTGTPRRSAVKPDEMKYIPIMIWRVSETDKIPLSSALRNHDNEFSC